MLLITRRTAHLRSSDPQLKDSHSNDIPKENFNYSISLPIQLSELNKIIENSVVKKSFSNNSSIKIKNYILDKNEKKLFQKEKYTT